MPTFPTLPSKWIHNKYRREDGSFASGKVTWSHGAFLDDSTDNETTVPTTIEKVLGAAGLPGEYLVELHITNDPQDNPTGTFWTCTEQIDNTPVRVQQFQILATQPHGDSAADPIEFADLVPVVVPATAATGLATQASVTNLASRVTALESGASPAVPQGGANNVYALRQLGTGAGQAVPGNDPSVTNTRTPSALSVATGTIIDGAVTTVKIANGGVTSAKVDSTIVTSTQLTTALNALAAASIDFDGNGSGFTTLAGDLTVQDAIISLVTALENHMAATTNAHGIVDTSKLALLDSSGRLKIPISSDTLTALGYRAMFQTAAGDVLMSEGGVTPRTYLFPSADAGNARVAADTSITSTTMATRGMTVQVLAGRIYQFVNMIRYQGDDTSDLAVQYAVPASTVGVFQLIGASASAGSVTTPPNFNSHIPITDKAPIGCIAGQDMIATTMGFFQAGANGTFDAQVALNAGTVAATLRGGFNGSWLALQMIG
jgi:hypothetical protein